MNQSESKNRNRKKNELYEKKKAITTTARYNVLAEKRLKRRKSDSSF